MTMYYQQKRLRATQIHVEVGVNDMKRQLLLLVLGDFKFDAKQYVFRSHRIVNYLHLL